jgi:hypothetical protein
MVRVRRGESTPALGPVTVFAAIVPPFGKHSILHRESLCVDHVHIAIQQLLRHQPGEREEGGSESEREREREAEGGGEGGEEGGGQSHDLMVSIISVCVSQP